MKHYLLQTSLLVAAVSSFIASLVLYSGTLAESSIITEDDRNTTISATNDELPAHIQNDNFALGEYYFVQDADSADRYDLDKAKYHYLAAIRKNPVEHPSAWYQVARIDFVEGRLSSAIFNLEKQQEYFGDNLPNVYYMLGLTYGYLALETESQQHWQLAEENFIRYMEYAPESAWPRVDLAWVYFSQGKYEAMLPVLETGLEYNPDQAWLLNTYGLALLNTGDREAARQTLLRAQRAYKKLTVDDWQQAYQENDPQSWNRNFELFGDIIDSNLLLASQR
jgi:tetratricopeptide (TPR) repeat protein